MRISKYCEQLSDLIKKASMKQRSRHQGGLNIHPVVIWVASGGWGRIPDAAQIMD